jgi:transcription initiation factor IIE alpha subunit
MLMQKSTGLEERMSDLKEWRHIANHSTSGDMVWNILMDWQKSEDALRKKLDIAVGGLEELRDIMEEHSIFVCGVLTIVQDTLAEIEEIGGMNE